MPLLSIEIQDSRQTVLASNSGGGRVSLVYPCEYSPGTRIVLTSSEAGAYLVIQLDDAVAPSFVYMRGREYPLEVPSGDERLAYNPKAFVGALHLLTARTATVAEIVARKNLAGNTYDSHRNSTCFPHASASVETRGEAVFAARNAIDGNVENHSHGAWPYESWGINRDPDAELRVEFGRAVDIDEIVITLRADFPHDNCWKSAELCFSDGSAETVRFVKTDRPQTFRIACRRVESLTMRRMIPDENAPSPFPALSQIEVYGNEVITDETDRA